jgi:guanylate kinase
VRNREKNIRKVSRKKGQIFILSGPSGSGKTTLAERILHIASLKKKLSKSISFTTRPKRSSERNGKDYFFVTKERFLEAVKAKKILEWTKYLGYYYGTPKDFVDAQLDRGKHMLMCLDLRGVRRIKRLYPGNTVAIFISPPSLQILQERIARRCHLTGDEEICRRLARAKTELKGAHRFHHQVVNDDLNKVVRQLKEIIESRVRRHERNPE